MIFLTVTVTSQQIVHVNNCSLLPWLLLVTVQQVQNRKKVVNQRALMIKHVSCGVKLIKNPSNERSLGTTVLNIVIDNSESVVEVMSSIIGDDLIKLLTEQSNLYNSQNA